MLLNPVTAILIFLLLRDAPVVERAQPEIMVDRRPPTVERIMFDPDNLPADMPSLDPGEAALCQFNFNCAVKLKYESLDDSASGSGRVRSTVQVRRIHVTLTLHNAIYLPRGAPPKIRAHEEGHRVIAERVYEDAERVARAAAVDVLTQVWHGTGDDADAAGKAATDAAVERLCNSYLAGTAEKALRVGEIYDQLTSHGRNTRLTEADAIRRAFARYDDEASPAGDE